MAFHPVAEHGTVSDGFPLWLRMQHFLNLFFMTFIVRGGLQILADHPRLYWKRDCTPGTEWFRFQKEVPSFSTLPPSLVAAARRGPFSHGGKSCRARRSRTTWVGLGGVLNRPGGGTTWEVFPNALSTALQYLSLTFPPGSRLDALQQSPATNAPTTSGTRDTRQRKAIGI